MKTENQTVKIVSLSVDVVGVFVCSGKHYFACSVLGSG